MSGTFFMMMAAAGGVAEQPIDGQTGVWLKSGGVTVSSAMKMTGATVSSGQTQYIYSRGVASNTMALGVGAIYVSNGGLARDCYVSGGANAAKLIVTVGGTAVSCVLQTGDLQVNGYPSYGTLIDAVAYGGRQYFQNVAIVSNYTMSGGNLSAGEGGGAKRIYGMNVHGGVASIYNNTILSGAVIYAGGTLTVAKGATVSSVVVSSGGIQRVSSGGVAKECDVLHFQHILAGGTAIDCVVHYRQYVSSGGTATGTVLRVAPSLAASIYPALDIAVGAVASGVAVESGGTAWVHTVEAHDFAVSSGGLAQIYTGGTLLGVVVSSAGRLLVQSGASALAVTSNAGATITVSEGGYIEYA